MKIAVFGATGMVGTRVVAEATRRDHSVIAVARAARTGSMHPGTIAATADIRDVRRVTEILADADAAVSAVRPRPGEEAAVPDSTRALLDAAVAAATPILLVGGAGALTSPDADRLVLDDPRYVHAEWRASALASVEQLRACDGHPARWTYLSPPAFLEPGDRTGRYRRGTTTLLTDADGVSRIAAEDLAVAVLDELENPGADRHITVAY